MSSCGQLPCEILLSVLVKSRVKIHFTLYTCSRPKHAFKLPFVTAVADSEGEEFKGLEPPFCWTINAFKWGQIVGPLFPFILGKVTPFKKMTGSAPDSDS